MNKSISTFFATAESRKMNPREMLPFIFSLVTRQGGKMNQNEKLFLFVKTAKKVCLGMGTGELKRLFELHCSIAKFQHSVSIKRGLEFRK